MSDADRMLIRNLMPRNLRAEQAAGYVAVSESKFRQLVKDGRMPPSFQIDGCVLWDRFDLDDAIDKLKTERQTANFFDNKLGGLEAGK